MLLRFIGMATLAAMIFLGLVALARGISDGLRWQRYDAIKELNKETLQRLSREPGIGR